MADARSLLLALLLPRLAALLACLSIVTCLPPSRAHGDPIVIPRLELRDLAIEDQDDMCFWLHPTDLAQSAIVCSDKSANKIFVYDLEGHTLQVVAAQKPGNIDIRYRVPLGGRLVDVVAFNERNTSQIPVYVMDPVTRHLSRVDTGTNASGPNYGFTLYRSHDGRLYAFTGPENNTTVRQFELKDDGAGHMVLGPVLRTVQPGGVVEGMVADDATGMLYVSEEPGGVWKYSAEPGGGTAGTKIAAVGVNGLTADVEGITIYYRGASAGYLLVSSQGSSTFKVYDRQPPHAYLGTFTVQGVTSTDGIDVINLPLGSGFPQGVFACHNGTTSPFPVELLRWDEIATPLGLAVDTHSWDPRTPSASVYPVPVPDVRGLEVSPNPGRTTVTLAFTTGASGRARLDVVDVAGRRVETLHDGWLGAGPHAFTWSPRRGESRAAARPGVYLARLAGPQGATLSRRLVIVE